MPLGLNSTTSYQVPIQVPGRDFQVGRISTNSLSVSSIGASSTLPTNCSYNLAAEPNFIRCGSAVADFTIEDWDFRGLGVTWVFQNTKKVRFENCLFDLSNFNIQNAKFFDGGSGTPNVEFSYCTMRGLNSAIGVPAAFARRITLIEYCDIQDWPSDIFNLSPVSGLDTIVRYNRVRGACSAAASTGLHADAFQNTSWSNSGKKFQIYGNKVEMVAPLPAGVGVTGIFNFGSQDGDWNSNIEITDNLLVCGSAVYPIAVTENPGGTFSGSVTMLRNYITGIGTNAFYPSIKIPAGLSCDGLTNALTGAPVSFSYMKQDGSMVNGATSIS